MVKHGKEKLEEIIKNPIPYPVSGLYDANHFYEQGKADAMRNSMEKAKNIDMSPRGTHEKVKTSNGWSVRAVPSDADSMSKLKIKIRK